MTATLVGPTQDQTMVVLGDFIESILPLGTPVLQSQVNRTAEPLDDFVLMTPLRRSRLATNLDTYVDCQFTASIAGNVMTVSAVQFGVILIKAVVFGVGLTGLPTILTQLSGSAGGVGTYQLSASQGTITSEKMASGAQYLEQPTEVVVQLDVHGEVSADNSQVISTLFRDDYAVQFFRASGFDVSPLHADDPKQMPFLNEAKQYENRWVIEAVMQANERVSVPQQFADQIVLTLIPADIVYTA